MDYYLGLNLGKEEVFCPVFIFSLPSYPPEEAGISPELPAAPQAGGGGQELGTQPGLAAPSTPAAEEQNPGILCPKPVAGQCPGAAAGSAVHSSLSRPRAGILGLQPAAAASSRDAGVKKGKRQSSSRFVPQPAWVAAKRKSLTFR